MTTVTFEKKLNLSRTNYKTVADFLWDIDNNLIYEEYLERKLLEVKNAWKNDFVNL